MSRQHADDAIIKIEDSDSDVSMDGVEEEVKPCEIGLCAESAQRVMVVNGIKSETDVADEDDADDVMIIEKAIDVVEVEDETEEEEEEEDGDIWPPPRLRCSARGCLVNSTKDPDYMYFSVPTEPYDIYKEWLQQIDREDLMTLHSPKDNLYVCENHFLESDILHFPTHRELRETALPIRNTINITIDDSINDRKNVTNNITSPSSPKPGTSKEANKRVESLEKATQTTPATSEHHVQPKTETADAAAQVDFETADDYKRTIRRELIAAKRRLKHIHKIEGSEQLKKTQFQKACDHFLSPNLASLVKPQTDLVYNSNGNRFNLAHRLFSSSMFSVSPKAYDALKKDFCLPSSVQLRRQAVPFTTSSSDDLLSALKIKVKHMSESEKYCSVKVNLMKVKSHLHYNCAVDRIVGLHDINASQKVAPAQYALAVLIEGILVDWMQPIGFAFLSKEKALKDLSRWIDKLLIKLINIGLKIKAYVPHYESELLDEAKMRGISVNQPLFYIRGKRILFIFNVPDLMKQLYDCFCSYDFHYRRCDGSTGVAKHEHVKKFYERDVGRDLKLAPKLTDSHFSPATGADQITVTHAVQVFSQTVATGLNTYVEFKAIDESARDTVELLLLINHLFDLLNSSSLSNHPYKNAFTGNKIQSEILDRSLQVFESLKAIHTGSELDQKADLQFIAGFRITMFAISCLSSELRDKGFKELCTKRLNLDSTLNFFTAVRLNVTMDPTCQQFEQRFRRFCIFHMLKPPKAGRACYKDLMRSFICQTELQDNEKVDEDTPRVSKALDGFSELTEKYVSVTIFKGKLAKKTSMREVCSYLLQRCLKLHKACEPFKVFFDMFSSGGKGADPVMARFVNYVSMLERAFQDAFANDQINYKLGATIYEKIKPEEFVPPCDCFPTKFFQKLFIRLRIQMVVNYNNVLYRKNNEAKGIAIPKISLP